MNISIGILAHNEAGSLPATIRSLSQQSLLQPHEDTQDTQIEVVIVPNGCTDDTERIADDLAVQLANAQQWIRWRVHSLKRPGKTNAWNQFIHEISDFAADYIVMMDADIEFIEPATLANMIQALIDQPDASVAVDRPIKDAFLNKRRHLRGRLSCAISVNSINGAPRICGQLYCGRAKILRGCWMPEGLPVEDGFLRAMILTDRFTEPESSCRIVVAPNASHLFEAYLDLTRLIRHEQWLVISSSINAHLYAYLWKHSTSDCDAGELIRRNNLSNPAWLEELRHGSARSRRWWLIPRALIFRRFRRLHWCCNGRLIVYLCAAILAFPLDLLICIRANARLHSKYALDYWGKTNPPNSVGVPSLAGRRAN